MKQKRIIFLINELNFFISHRLPIAIELKKENHKLRLKIDIYEKRILYGEVKRISQQFHYF